ncbi:O-Glycosyl hydrolases family 17 protein [Wolffia australiana]
MGRREVALWAAMAVVLWVGGEGLGVNWGTQASHQLPPKTVVQMLKDNGFNRVKLFDADPVTMKALAGSGLEVMVAIPNKDLEFMTDYDGAKSWVKRSVTRYLFDGGVDIRYVAVGNEPFLSSYKGSFLNTTFPALQNIQNALNEAKVGGKIKATVPLNADVYGPTAVVPSSGRFRDDIGPLMGQIVDFLARNGAPFTVNIYPFLSLYADRNFPIDFAFFDGGAAPVVDGNIQYTNVLDANFDTLVAALAATGHGSMPVIIGEVGWPTDGDMAARSDSAEKFYAGLLRQLAGGAKFATPARPGGAADEVYLFGLIDEDAKSIAPGNFERHWGIFRYDGQPKFAMDLSGQRRQIFLTAAKNVKYQPAKWCVFNPAAEDLSKLGESITYACTFSDCTALGYGSSCNGLDARGNASYAFNMFFQVQNQAEESCYFNGLATVTTQNPSTGTCNFTIQIVGGGASGGGSRVAAVLAAAAAFVAAVLLLI